MPKLIITPRSVLESLCVAFFPMFIAAPAFAQPNSNVIEVSNAKVEGHFLEAADGSIRVVQKLTAVDGQYLECSGEGPKKLGQMEQFKGPASCDGNKPGVKPGQFSFDFKMTPGDSLIIHVPVGWHVNQHQIQLKDGGLLNIPGSIITMKHGEDQVILKAI